MSKQVNTYSHFLPLKEASGPKVITKNDHYFNLVFLGGNYLSRGSIFQRIFGGKDEVCLIAGLRLQPDGLLINSVEEPNIVLDKRPIKPGKVTNIPLTLNLLTKIPVYMDSIGFTFKVATTKRTDNFSLTLDVLNDSANKSVIDTFMPNVVGKALGIGKVVKDMFDKIDVSNNRDLIQLVVTDFIVSARPDTVGPNTLQEGYIIIFVKNEAEEIEEEIDSEAANDRIILDDGFENLTEINVNNAEFINVKSLEINSIFTDSEEDHETVNLEFDEINKILKSDGKVVINSYLVFKVQREIIKGENLNASWSKKFNQSVDTLANEFVKTRAKLEELRPQVLQFFNEATALLSEDASFTPVEKKVIREKYRVLIEQEQTKFI